jgi:multidrug transporter EmrE-like cation transporter
LEGAPQLHGAIAQCSEQQCEQTALRKNMTRIPFLIVIQFIAATGLQVIGVALLPSTRGFTQVGMTALCVLAFVGAVCMLARLTYGGASFGVLIPLSAIVVPLVSVAVGVIFYGEPASVYRIGLLLGACAMVGVASHSGWGWMERWLASQLGGVRAPRRSTTGLGGLPTPPTGASRPYGADAAPGSTARQSSARSLGPWNAQVPAWHKTDNRR